MHSMESHFGKEILKREYKGFNDTKFVFDVSIKTEETAFMQFLRENMSELKLISPPALVGQFKKELQSALDMYT